MLANKYTIAHSNPNLTFEIIGKLVTSNSTPLPSAAQKNADLGKNTRSTILGALLKDPKTIVVPVKLFATSLVQLVDETPSSSGNCWWIVVKASLGHRTTELWKHQRHY